ncbi:MAG: DUF2852 domain-containing protein [Hyphomicrobiales bacterium]
MNTSSATDFGSHGGPQGETSARAHGCDSRKWSGLELAAMIGGFVVFWPLGLAALGLKLVRGEIWPGSRNSEGPWTAYKAWKDETGGFKQGFTAPHWGTAGSSGNTAFDAYRKQQLDRLEAERRKLDEDRKAFADYLAKLRRAKDQDEFDRFMAERTAPDLSPGK